MDAATNRLRVRWQETSCLPCLEIIPARRRNKMYNNWNALHRLWIANRAESLQKELTAMDTISAWPSSITLFATSCPNNHLGPISNRYVNTDKRTCGMCGIRVTECPARENEITSFASRNSQHTCPRKSYRRVDPVRSAKGNVDQRLFSKPAKKNQVSKMTHRANKAENDFQQ